MKTGTKVAIGGGVAAIAAFICCKWGPCCSCFAQGNDAYVIPAYTPPTMAEPTTAAGPMIPSPTDFDAVQTNVPSVVSFKSPPDYILE